MAKTVKITGKWTGQVNLVTNAGNIQLQELNLKEQAF